MLTDVEIITAVVSNSGYPGAFKHWQNIVKALEPKTCSSCKWWEDSFCANWNKIKENEGKEDSVSKNTDRLIYTYHEGGGFQTGPNFGCVHHKDQN
jgi:hypothetical protein